MIDFQKVCPAFYSELKPHLHKQENCEYAFVNLCIWGKQKTAHIGGHYAFFSQFNRHMVYLFPVGDGDVRPVVDAILSDARQRDIRCYLTGLDREKCGLLEQLYPGKFRFHTDRDDYDYLYSIADLAQLPDRKYQKKRNHVNRFRALVPNWCIEPLTGDNRDAVCQMAEDWYAQRRISDPLGDYYLERQALHRALKHWDELPLEGLILRDRDRIIGFSIASALSADTYDIHFEKAREDVDGAYAAINQAFSAWLRDKHPQLQYLNREDDIGLEGLRKAKLSYYPVRLIEKFWATPKEDGDE